MKLQNAACTVDITIDDAFAIDSADNRPYDAILNPGNFRENGSIVVFSIKIATGGVERNIALIGDEHAADADCVVLNQDHLVVLMNDAVSVLNMDSLEIEKYIELSGYGCYFSIHPFAGGYVVYGEVDIVKLSSYFALEWTFNGRDILISMDDSKEPFKICGNRIEVYDWLNWHYILDENGRAIYEEREE